jgi:hypothetical protein
MTRDLQGGGTISLEKTREALKKKRNMKGNESSRTAL